MLISMNCMSTFITYLVQIKPFLYDQYDRSKLHIFTPRENNRLLDYYKIISISRPILARANMVLDFVSGQYGCLFSRCRKYVINSLIHGHFHIGLVIISRPILTLDSVSGQYGGLGLITRPIWKCPCINLYLLNYFQNLFDTAIKTNIISLTLFELEMFIYIDIISF